MSGEQGFGVSGYWKNVDVFDENLICIGSVICFMKSESQISDHP